MAQATNRADKAQPCMQIRENELEVSVTSGNILFFGLTPSRRVRGSASFPNLKKRCLHLRVRENCEVSFINIYIYMCVHTYVLFTYMCYNFTSHIGVKKKDEDLPELESMVLWHISTAGLPIFTVKFRCGDS